MKKRLLLPLCVLLLFAHLLSRCSDSLITPVNENNLIPNPSFELNGVSTVAFWFVNMPSLVHFTNDTPTNGGNWAITIDVLWGSGNDVISTVIIPEGTHIYKFSFWSKYSNKPGFAETLLAARDSLYQINRIIVDSESWKNYSILDTITSVSGDSLKIKLSGGFSNIVPGKTYFDLCTLELLE
ncbi:MAG: hypothetical protein DRQ01_06280 [Ignavibacteriae bacterium]|nr:MAG: hypothetical protein DRQ01_06280 [Ignavibacteriota bacterium]